MSTSNAQDFRATVNGRITDTAGAAVPGATVTVRNPETNETGTAIANDEGNYTIPFLKPGTYSMSAEQAGFKRSTVDQQVLQVGQSATVNFQLQVGEVTETVTVISDAGTLDSSKADRGQVIDNARVTELPLNARNPFMLSTLSPGISYNGPAIYQRPFDNGAIADWSINGGQNRNNEFLLDGAPNNANQGGNNLAYVPPVDAVGEFKIVTNQYDAQYGRSAGGTVNVSLKSGTNNFHGTVYEFARRSALEANSLLQNAQGQPRVGRYLDQYGFEVDGPVYLPRFGQGGPAFYSGKNKTFFMFNFEGYREGTPNPDTRTFPDERQRVGDFSQLRDRNGRLIPIYDPLTGTPENNFTRQPFPGNIIPANRINPIAQQILSYYPLPNTTTPGVDPFRQNFIQSPNIATDTFYNYVGKVDQNFGDRTKTYYRYAYNKRTELRNTNGVVDSPAEDGPLPLERINYTGVADFLHTFSPTFILNLRVSANRYIEASRSDRAFGFSSAQLGLPQSLVNQLPVQVFPRINLADYTSLGRDGFSNNITNVFSFQPNATYIRGSQTIRTGLDMRLTQSVAQGSGVAGGRLEFNRTFTRRLFDQDDTAISGNSVASLLLGAPSGGTIANNPFRIFLYKYFAPWIQDDWKVSQRLTLNFGFRWDFNGPPVERFDRYNFGFDPNVINPVSARIDQTRFPGFQVRGGLGFTGVNGNPRYAYNYDKNNFQPRAGFAYLLNDRTVVRAGFGRYFLNATTLRDANGFSIETPLIGSLDSNRTPLYNLSNPFPTGVAQPPGASLGLLTDLGRGPGFQNPDFKIPYIHQFSVGIQRQLPFGASLDISYVGSRGYQLQTPGPGGTMDANPAFAFNEPSLAFRNQCDVKASGNPDFCNQLVPNPFRGVPGFEGTARFTAATLTRYDLARPFPQFSGFAINETNDGRSWYNSLQVTANRRFSRGFTINGTYTFAKHIEQSGYVDSVARNVDRSVYFSDRPHRVTASSVFELPFGKGRRFFSNANGLVDRIINGFELSPLFVFNSGRPWNLGDGFNIDFITDPKNPNPVGFVNGAKVIQAVIPCVVRQANNGSIRNANGSYAFTAPAIAYGCTEPNMILRPAFTTRTTPFSIGQIRRPSYTQFDINVAKSIRIKESMRLQLRAEFFNVTNTPSYEQRNYGNNPNNADFGQINYNTTAQSNFPRQIQLAAKFIF